MAENTPPDQGPQQPQEPPQPQQPPQPEQPPAGGEPPSPGAEAQVGGEVPQDARTMGMLCHILALAGYIVPFGNVIGPLVMWLLKKDEHPFINDQGKESLNWQITMLIAAFVSALLMLAIIGWLLLPAVGVINLVFVILGTVKANQGEWFRYPWSIKFIK